MPIPCPSRATHRAGNQKTRWRGARWWRAHIVVAVLFIVLCLMVLVAGELVLLRSAGS